MHDFDEVPITHELGLNDPRQVTDVDAGQVDVRPAKSFIEIGGQGRFENVRRPKYRADQLERWFDGSATHVFLL